MRFFAGTGELKSKVYRVCKFSEVVFDMESYFLLTCKCGNQCLMSVVMFCPHQLLFTDCLGARRQVPTLHFWCLSVSCAWELQVCILPEQGKDICPLEKAWHLDCLLMYEYHEGSHLCLLHTNTASSP